MTQTLDFPSVMTSQEKFVIDDFHSLYYLSKAYGIEAWGDTYWGGLPILKCPMDLWLYQEIIYKVRPDLIIETGTAHGGSALYLANILDLMGKGKVLTIDTKDKADGRWERPKHPRIEYLCGDSISIEVLKEAYKQAKGKSAMVILDSDHHRDHVLSELQLYGPLISLKSYMIVEDTNINGHPVGINFGPGPLEAAHEFLQNNKEFAIDASMGKFLLSFNTNGYLIRVK